FRPRTDIASLTERQRQVLDLLMTGATNKEIAARLVISEATAKLHILHILRALGASNRTEAAIIAQRFLAGEA
ncbi:MAG: helix-turn-helix transcriptional regulator, partial [Alphaproteobacteria bacterium]|nr:helix-turn-helix transcriptional regulator [Alphaproteobacteria bacterium]